MQNTHRSCIVAFCALAAGLCFVILPYSQIDSIWPGYIRQIKAPGPVFAGSITPMTEVILISPKNDSISIGNLLHFHINSNLTNSGEEFYSASLLSASNPCASTAGHMVDHANGTYSLYFYAGWVGTATLSVTRVLTKEAVTFIQEVLWDADDRVVWQGYFNVDGASGDPNKMPKGLCKLRNHGNWTGMCVYRHPKALGKTVFVCEKPPDTECDSLYATKSDGSKISSRVKELTRGVEAMFEKNKYYRQPVKVIEPIITISESNRPIALKPRLPKCVPDQQLPKSHGFWLGENWHSLICEISDWTKETKLASCLRHKTLVLLGASTTRQWFLGIHELLSIPFKRTPEDHNFSWRRDYTNLNTSIYFTSPPQLIGSLVVYMKEVNYEVDVLDGLDDSFCNYIILISPWAHFSQWAREYYIERTYQIREALIRFRKRCPDVKIVLKGPHAREHKNVGSSVYASDYILKEIEKINRKAFSGIGVWFLPIWDMNMAYPALNTIHMPMPVIKEELKMFFSYVCEN